MDQHARRLNRGVSLVALADTLTRTIAQTKRRLLAGGVLQEVQWGIPDAPRDPPDPLYPPDVRGRRSITWSMIDAYIQSSPALDYGRLSTERVDDMLLVFIEPLAIKDNHIFRWGDPPTTHRVKKIVGLLQDETTGVRYSSEVTVTR